MTAIRDGYGTAAVGVTIVSDATASAPINLTPLSGTIAGTITDPQENPITGNNLQLQVLNQNGQLIKTVLANSDGTFIINGLAPGNYQVTVTAPNFATGSFSSTVISEQTTSLNPVLLPNPATVNVTVTSQDTGLPLAGAVVTAALPNGSVTGVGVTDVNGFVSIENLPAQSLNLSVSADNFSSFSQAINLVPGQTINTSVSLESQIGTLSGTIFDANTQRPIAGATVEVFDFTRGLITTAVTDAFGNFQVQNLSAGVYRFIASVQNYGSTVQESTIAANQQTVLNIFLPPNPGSIQGTIFNQQTGDPVSGASVTIRQFSPTGPVIASASTDQNGQFTVDNLAPGAYTVIASDSNFGTQSGSVFVSSNTESSITLSLTPSPGAVQGTLTNSQTGEPLAGALIRIQDNNGTIIREVQTNENGIYFADGLAPGNYSLIGITPSFQRDTIGFNAATNTTTTVNLALSPNPGAITGRISDQQTGEALAGASVQLFPSQGLFPIANALTDQNGNYTIIGLAPGEYIVAANASNYARGAVGAIVFADQSTVANIGLIANPATISGTVTSTGETPIPNASIRVIDLNEVVLGSALTDQNGSYVIGNLPPGSHTIIISADTFAGRLSGITLIPGDFLENINFVLTPNPGSLTGRVTNAQTGDPVAGAISVVRLTGGTGVIAANDVTDANGFYFITGLAPGTYTVTVSKTGFGTVSVGGIVFSGTTTAANLQLRANTGSISGVLTDLQGSPILGMNTQVQVYDQNGSLVKTLLAQSDGTYSVLDLLPGSYTLIITAPNFAAAMASAVVVSDQTTQTNISLSPNPAAVTGQVLNAGTGNVISGAVVTVTDINGIIIASATSGIDGSFSIPNLPPATLLISASAQNFGADSKAILLSPGEEEATTLSLTPNPGTLSGTATNALTGDLIAGAVLQVFDFTRALVATVLTDQNGEYQVQNLSPGLYRVIAAAESFGFVTQDAIVSSNAVTTLEFTLPPNPGVITGTIYNQQTGAPIQGASIVIRKFSPAGPVFATTATNAQGDFTVFNLAPGTYSVIASQNDFGTQAASAFVQSNQTTSVLLNLPPDPGIVQGTITSTQTGTALPDTIIRVIDSFGSILAVSQTDVSGVYRIEGLDTGTYSLVVINERFQRQTLGFTVESNQTVILNASLSPNPGFIVGTVSNIQQGLPISGAAVQLFPSESIIPVAEAVTGQNGTFTIVGLEPGDYSVVATASNFGSVTVGAVVIADGTTSVAIQLTPLPAVISGQVTDLSGNKIPNATVRVLDQNQNVVGTGATDLNGNYSIGNLAPGTFTVVASAPNFGTALQGVTVVAAQELTGINLALQANPGSITGQVTNSSTAAPIAGATVAIRSLQGNSGAVVQSVNTDQFGKYLAQNLAPGVYSVTVTKSGFAQQTQTVTVASNQSAAANFALLPDTGSISGNIRDGNGNPITGGNVFIRVFDSNGVLIKSVTAQSDGTYGILDLAPGTYNLVAEAPNYSASTVTTVVEANQTTALDIQLAPNPASVIGQVLIQGMNTPLQGAVVTSSVNGQLIASTVTDVNGNFQLTNLPPGNVEIAVSQPGFALDVQTVNLNPGETEQITVSLATLPGAISGTIINQQTSDPISGAAITIRQFSPAGPVAGTAVTDAQGTFLVTGLPPGSYTVVAQAAAFGTQAASSVVFANEVSDVMIGLTPTPGTIQGTVRSTDGNVPLPGSTVRVIRRDGTLVDEALTDGSGFYVIEGLPADSYTLFVLNESYQNLAIGFDILPAQVTELDVFLSPNPGVLTGTVTDLFSGGPIAEAVVLVFPSQGVTAITQTVTDQNGQFSVTGLAPGEYNIVASASNYSRRGAGAVIFADQTTNIIIQLAPNPATITGTITGPGGTPLTNATVRVLDQNETVLGTAITDEKGIYAIGNLSAGTLTIIASAPDFAATLTAVTVTPGQLIPNVNIELTPLFGTISGQITNANTGDPIVGAIAVVRTVGGTSVIITSDTTDAAGNYLIRGLAPGSYSIVGTASGFGAITVGAIVSANETATANIALPPETGMVAGTLTDAAGNPVTGSNIAVQVFDINGILIKTLLADFDGTFTIIDLAPGTYLVQITAPNYATSVASVNITANQTTSLPIVLTPNPATITGLVINKDTSAPLSGVIITVSDLNGLIAGNAISDQNGQFTIQNLPPNTVNVSAAATKPGFGSTSVSVQLGPGAVNSVTLALSPVAGSLTGTVRNALTGDTVSGATVQVFDFTRALAATVVTDQNGRYLVNNLAPGNVRVVASASDLGTVVQETVIAANVQTLLDFDLIPNPGRISGTIINQQTGLPLSGVSITIRQFSPTGPIAASSATDGNGAFTIPNLAPGSYTVLASYPGFGTQAGSTTVSSGETSVIQLALPPNPGTIQGIVTNAATQLPLVNTLIRVVDVNGVLTSVGQTDSDGRYSVQNLPPGSYTITAINTEYQQQTVGAAIVSGQTATLNIQLQPNPGSITGIVTSNQTGLPLAGSFVQLFPSQGLQPIASAMTDSLGQYTFIGIKPGIYTVTADLSNFGRSTVGATVFANAQATSNLALTPNPATVSGTVTDLNGTPIANATVRLLNGNETVLGTGITSEDGTYTISGLPPFTLNIIVTASGFSTFIAAITLSPGEVQTGIDFSLAANPGSLTGTVTEVTTGNPLAGASVVVRNTSGIIVASSYTNTDGSYTIQNLAPGQYSTVFTAEGYGITIIGAQIVSDTTIQLNAALSPLTGSISGIVLDEQGQQITGQNILVKIFNENLVLIEALTAQADGTFLVSGLLPGTYLVNASAPGYGANTVSSIVFAGQETATTVNLASSPATLSGSVVNTVTGAGIPGAFLTVTRTNGVIIATSFSGEQGAFSFPSLPPGTYTLSAQAQGFGNEALSVILNAGEVTNTILSLEQITGRVLGQVKNAANEAPIAGAILQVFDENRTLITTIVTDVQGNFSFPNLAPGQYTAIINANNFGSELRGFKINPNADTVLAVDLAPNPGVIQGRVTNPEGSAPIPSASVIIRALSPAGPIIATTLTDSNGFYQVTGLAPGSYSVIFSGAPSFGSEIATVGLDPGETEAVNATLAALPGAVQGQLTDEAGAGIPGALVQLFDLQGALVRRVQTDVNGNYLITGFTAGSYILSVIQQNFQSATAGFAVQPGQSTEVNFTLLASPGSISGVVRDAVTTQPVPGAVVQLYPSQSLVPIAFAVTDQQGSYTFNGLEPGSYLVTAAEFNYSSASAGATVVSNQQTQAALFLQPNPASLSGIVTDAFGTPINNASVKALDQNETVIGFAETGPDGTYFIGNLPSGNFTLVVSAENFQSVLSGVTLATGEQRTEVNFALAANPGSITGSVTGAFGNPVTGGVVTVRIAGAGDIIIATAVTDPDGQYTIGNLPPGSYTVTVTAQGFAVRTVGAIVQSDTTTTANVSLTGIFGSIAGVVLDNLAQPFVGTAVAVSLFDENGILIFTAIAHSDGSFAFPQVPPGSYVITASANGFVAGVIGAVVTADTTTNVTILLQTGPATITGVVTNNVTDGPVQGAIVIASTTDGQVLAIAASGADGSFTISNLLPGTVIVSATAPNFGNDSKAVLLQANTATQTTLALSPNPGFLTGTVTDRNLIPIPGSAVQIYDLTNGLTASVLTDSFGQYRIEGLTPGTYRADFNASGFERLTAGAVITAGQTTQLNVQLDDAFGVVNGTVFNAQTRSPIQGAAVTLRYQSPSGPIFATVLTDNNGRFNIQGVTQGEVSIVANAAGYGAQGLSAIVFSGQTVSFNFLLLQQTASIQGSITSLATGAPLPDTRIRVINSSGVVVVTTQTDDIGRYIVPNLVPGTYQVVALNPNFQAQTQTISLNPSDIAAVNFALLANPADLTGTVIDEETRQPIVGALVEVFDEFGVSIAFGLTDQNGEYLIQGLPQGIFTVRASAPGYLSETASADLGAGENVLNFELRRVPESSSVIAGTVTDSISGAPITGARIDLNNSRGELVGFTFTDSNGQYYFEGLEPDTYNISASAEGYLEAQLTLTLEAGESDLNANISLIRASGLGSIRGQVRNAKNNLPIAGARVEILNSQGVLVAAVSTDSSGFFEVQGLLPGRYTVRASASLYITGSTEAVVKAGETTNVTLLLTMDLASLSGTVTDEKNGKPIPCALISAFNQAVKLNVFGKTDENGKYVITALVPGTYSVRVSAKGYLTETVTVTLEPGENLVLDFQLKPLNISKGVIIGKVYDNSTKKPIKGAKVELLTCNGKRITSQKTNQKGIYHYKNLPQGKYILIVRSKGYQKEKKKVNLCNGHSILEVNFYLNAADYFGTIKGKVKDAKNKSKISHALIEVFNESGEKIASTYTDSKGKYKIKNLPEGRLAVHASAPEYHSQTSALVSGEKLILDFQLVPLSFSKRVITGKVYDETTKKPIKGAKVELLTSNGMRISSKKTNKKGICHFKDLPQGKYILIVRSKGYQKTKKKVKLGKGHSILKVIFHLNLAD
ncbi:carboxypeptidase regulatory-like domain-containing protein [Peribacillus phoenicis]|uniref:carboxypeptidase regulatory-like domain-containing protein n=1 Tax=unclassified Peribacillus TaxID=2675266 RepID=UPI0039A24EE0